MQFGLGRVLSDSDAQEKEVGYRSCTLPITLATVDIPSRGNRNMRIPSPRVELPEEAARKQTVADVLDGLELHELQLQYYRKRYDDPLISLKNL